MEIDHTPWLGTAAPPHATRTTAKLGDFALAQLHHARRARGAYLDVGCGNGVITELVARPFERVVAVDVEPERLGELRARVAGDGRFSIRLVGARGLEVDPGAFDLVTAFEVLEHVEDVAATAADIARAVAPGGVVVLSVPQIGFPIETHGVRLGGRIIERKVPLLPWIPPLHRRLALARVFGSRELDRLFGELGLEHLETAYAAPQFERAARDGARWESRLAALRPVLERLESTPVLRRLVGVSILKAYRRP